MCYIHLACRAAKQRRVHSCRRKRRSANSVAASLAQRQRRSVAASQRRSVTASLAPGSVAASQRHPAPRASQRRSVAAPPAPGSVTAQRRKPTFRPPLPLHCVFTREITRSRTVALLYCSHTRAALAHFLVGGRMTGPALDTLP